MDIWTEQLERRHLPILERWLGRTAGAITPNDLPSDVIELRTWFERSVAEPGRLDCLALVYETPVGVAGLRSKNGQKDTLEVYLMLGEVGYNLRRTATYVALRMIDRAFSNADVAQVAVWLCPCHTWFLDVLYRMGFAEERTENEMTVFTVEKDVFLNRKYLF